MKRGVLTVAVASLALLAACGKKEGMFHHQQRKTTAQAHFQQSL